MKFQHDYQKTDLKNQQPLQASDREEAGDPDHHKDHREIYEQLNLE